MFAEELRATVQEAMWDRDIQQVELARGAGMTEGAISRFLRGERFLSPEAIDRVLDVLGLEIVIRPRERGEK
jgi:transcriptional regulator with XRE-family HTH domain